jgi:hypothetical protein
MHYYKLVDKKPIRCDLKELFLQDNSIAKNKFGDVEVSTIFLFLDHSFMSGEPILFETMIFGGENDGYQMRYSTYEDSLIGHENACNLVNKVKIDRENKLNDLGI